MIAATKSEEEAFKHPPYLILHWVGKLLPQATNRLNLEDRIAVMATGKDFEELLGIPVAVDGTGAQVAATVFQQVVRLGLQEKIVGLSFNTTASNSGMLAGACIRLQETLGRLLLWLACRHHIYEVVLKYVFDACLGP